MKQKILAILLALGLAAATAGCGGGGNSTSPADSTGDGATASAGGEEGGSSGEGASATGNDLVIAFHNDIQALDPHDTRDTLSITVTRTMYEGLIGFDDDQNIVPVLAESYEAADDNLTYTFHLRQGVKFHDGEDFNADAFIKNYERVMADDTLNQYRRAATWETVEAVDDYTLVIKLKEPHSSFLNQFTQFCVVSPKALDELGRDGLAKNCVGTGPYTFDQRVEGDYVRVLTNGGYWGEAPGVDSLTFRNVPEDGARVAMLQTGEAAYIYRMPSVMAETVDGSNDIEVVANPSNIMRYVTLNTNLPELSDKRVRQAMNYAINKDALIKTVFSGYAVEVQSVYPSTIMYYSPQTAYDFNLEKAKELMAEAGYADGFKITIWGDNTTEEQKGMQFVQQQLAQIDIDLEVLPMEPNTIGDMIYVPLEEATINTWYVNWSASSFDADGSMRNILHREYMPPTSANTAYWDNQEFSDLLDEARSTTDPSKLAQLYADAQKIAWEEAPWLFLASDQVLAGKKSYVSGISLRPDGFLDVSKAKLS